MYGTSTGELKIVIPSAGNDLQRDVNLRSPTGIVTSNYNMLF